MQPEQQQWHSKLLMPHGQQQLEQRRQCRQPGVLLLAHINSSIAQQQQHWQQQIAWPWRSSKQDTAASTASISSKTILQEAGNGSMDSGGAGELQCEGPGCNPLASVALLPGTGGSKAAAEQHVPVDGFKLPRHPVQQLQQQQEGVKQPDQQTLQQPMRSPAGAHFASATFSGNGNSRGDRQLGPYEGPPLLGLRAIGRAINSEAGKLLGILGAQLLMHAANLQRGMQALQQHQQQTQQDGQQRQTWRPRMPWQRQRQQQQQQEAVSQRQSSSWQASEAAKQWVSRGITAETRMELREALACYTNAVTLEPGNVELICRLAKQWSDLTYEDGATVEQIQEVNGKAIEYAERAITMAPKAAAGYMASCVSRGRLALFSDNKTKVRLAKEAQEAARTALALEPENDLAHHLMGRWHFEMAQINFMVRQLIKLVYGAALAPGKFEDALTEFETAVRLNPTRLIHRVELGRSLLRMGQKREAYEQLTASMSMEVEDINAQLQKEDAELMLDKLKGEFERSVSWGGFTPSPAASVASAAAAAVAEDSSNNSSGGSSSSSGKPGQ